MKAVPILGAKIVLRTRGQLDHSLFDVYIGGSLWQSYDGYAPTEGERVIHLPADARLEIRNRADRNIRSSGYVIRFKQLDALEVKYDERTIQYTYDALSRLTEANYNNGATIYTYGFDLAGNLVNNNGASRTYNAANQLVNDGTNNLTYDANGNMTSDGVNSYAWDRANRLLSMGGVDYAYDGDGRRISQTAASIATKYLLDVQPALANVLGQTMGTDTSYFIHSPRGIHAMQNPSGAWSCASQDGLGSVRQEVDAVSKVLATGDYQPFGTLENVQGTFGLPFKFTGEEADFNELVHLRKRYYVPQIGIFPSLDPFEGVINRPMSLNGYSWVEGNPVNKVDPSGLIVCSDLRNDLPNLVLCFLRVFDLALTFGITLTEEDGLSPKTKDNWTSPRVNNVHSATRAINAQLGGFTRQAIGDTNIRLVREGVGCGAARASNCNTINLFLNFTECGTGRRFTNHTHTVSNIVHEFGHTLTLSSPTGRIINSEAFGSPEQMQHRPVALWNQITTLRSVDEGEGWSNNRLRESQETIAAEIVADMFLFWVMPGLGFSDTPIGQVRRAFSDGGAIPAPVVQGGGNLMRGDGSEVISAGFIGWAQNASCPLNNSEAANAPEIDYVVLVNGGWCLT